MEPSVILLILVMLAAVFRPIYFEVRRRERQRYYREVYLQSDEWKRKRYVVLKRDNWTCVYCGAKATQVHHTRYAKKNIGREPIDWLVSICSSCHSDKHPSGNRSPFGMGRSRKRTSAADWFNTHGWGKLGKRRK